jgi:two-component system CheB/CheR fusion protein
VLLVDDDADTRAGFRELLELHGASVATAATAAEARGAHRAADLDVLVIDIRLPDADGYVLVRELREAGRRPGLPAVAVTAYAAEEDEGRARAAGFHAHFGKPVEPTRLVAAIAELAVAPVSAS